MTDLARLLTSSERPGRVVYGVASGDNTVAVRGATTAVTLPALVDVYSGEYVAVWESGADRLILGPVDRGWTSFTPSWTNVTTTSGTSVGRYIYTPDGIRVRASFVAGASSAITGAVSLTIPNSETSAATIPSLGNCLYFDSSTSTTYQGLVVCDASATAIDFFFENSELDATNPVAMQTSDQFRMDVVIQL